MSKQVKSAAATSRSSKRPKKPQAHALPIGRCSFPAPKGPEAISELQRSLGIWLKIHQQGQTAGVGPCVHLPGQPILEYRFSEPFLTQGAGHPPKAPYGSGKATSCRNGKLCPVMDSQQKNRAEIIFLKQMEGY